MLKLMDHVGKRVRVRSAAGNIYEGRVGDYCYPEDDENDLEMIVVDVERKNGVQMNELIGFYAKDVDALELLDV